MDAHASRSFMEGLAGADYNLVDVREPREYQSGHLPGAQLIPMGELEKRSSELDPELPTFVY